MADSTMHTPLQSWIPPRFGWTALPNVFFIEISINDRDIVEFISTGICEVKVADSKSAASISAALLGTDTLRGQLNLAVWDRAKLRPEVSPLEADTKVLAYFLGALLLPREQEGLRSA